jgi:hypothetical protein
MPFRDTPNLWAIQNLLASLIFLPTAIEAAIPNGVNLPQELLQADELLRKVQYYETNGGFGLSQALLSAIYATTAELFNSLQDLSQALKWHLSTFSNDDIVNVPQPQQKWKKRKNKRFKQSQESIKSYIEKVVSLNDELSIYLPTYVGSN